MDDHNLYRAPQSTLGRNLSVGVNTIALEVLSSGSIWARITSIVDFVFFTLFLVYTLLVGVSLIGIKKISDPILIITAFFLIFGLINLIAFWFMGHSMQRYAKASKTLRSYGDENEVAICFESSSRFLKSLSIFLLIIMVIFLLVILASIGLSSYIGYLINIKAR